MDDYIAKEISASRDSDLEVSTVTGWPDDHDEVFTSFRSDRIAVRVKDVLVNDAMLACAGQDYRLHIKLSFNTQDIKVTFTERS